MCSGGLVGLLMIGGKMYLSHTCYKRRAIEIEALANEQGWQYRPGFTILLSGSLPNGETWQIRPTFGEDYRYLWQAPVKTSEEGVWVTAHRAGMFMTLFSGPTRYKDVGPPELQRQYFLAATDKELLHRVLTPDILNLLLNWPRRRWRTERSLKISLGHDRLRISTEIDDSADHLARLVDLGTTLINAYGQA